MNDNIIQELTRQVSSAMMGDTDSIIREAITRFLGRDDWTLEEMKGRCEMIRHHDAVESLCIDCVEVALLYPIKVIMEEKVDVCVLHATRQYRWLLHDEKKPV